jgi:uncharacterized membrane protein YebE (DUF533 family)
MSLMGTLAKIAIGYAAAKGVDKLSGGQGLGSMLGGGAQVSPGDAQADQMPGLGNMQEMMSGLMGGGAGGLQDMMSKLTQGGSGMQDMMQQALGGQGGFDLSALMGGAATGGGEDKGGLLSGVPGGGAGIAGLLAAMGGAAAMSGKGVGAMMDQFQPAQTAPQMEDAAGLMLRAMIQAAKADGEIDADEQAKIMDTVGDDADADDIAFVRDQLAAPVDIDGLAADTPEALKAQVYSMSLMSIRVDTQGEAQYLDALAKALGLNQQVVNALHMQMGVQPLYG